MFIGTSGGKEISLLKLPEGFLSYSCEDNLCFESIHGNHCWNVTEGSGDGTVPMVSQGIPFTIVNLQISSELGFILPLCYRNYFCTGTLKKKKKVKLLH